MNNAPGDDTNIRDAADTDIPALVKLIRTSFSEVAAELGLNEQDYPRSTSFYTIERMQNDFTKGIRYFILEKDGNAIGCVAMEEADEGICYLMRLGVLPDHRKQNHGERLVRHVLEQAKQTGSKQVQIGIVDAADRLKRWYASLGFVQFKTQTFDHLPFLVAFMSIDV